MTATPDDQDSPPDDESFEAHDDRPARDVVIIFAVFFEAGLAPLSVFLGWLLSAPPLASFRFSLQDAALGVLAAVPLVLLFVAMLRWPVGPLKRVESFCDLEAAPLFAGRSWSEFALISLSAGVGEEMLFRGVVQTSLSAWIGTQPGVVVASLLFGLFHPISFTYMVLAAVLGLYLGEFLIFNQNLLSVMVAHAVYDLAALGYLVKIRPRFNAS